MKRISCLILLFSLISALPQSTAHAQYGRIPSRYTRKLPAIDKVEMQKLKPSEYGFQGIEEIKTFEGKEAQQIASLWRTQDFHRMPASCHQPVFGIKFFFRDKTILHASVCWDCNNLVVLEPKLKSNPTQGFAGDTRMGQKLLEEFKRTFP